MRVLVLRLRALRARLQWLTTALSLTARVADVLGMAWLVTLLNAAVLALLLLLVVLDLALKALVRQLRRVVTLVLHRLLDAADLLRQLLRLQLLVAVLLLSSVQYENGFKPYMSDSLQIERGTLC